MRARIYQKSIRCANFLTYEVLLPNYKGIQETGNQMISVQD